MNSSWIAFATKRFDNPFIRYSKTFANLLIQVLQRYFYWRGRDASKRVSRNLRGTDKGGESWLCM